MTAQGPYREPESTTTKWVVIFILISLLAHALIIAIIVLITIFMPPPKVKVPKPDSTNVTLTLQPAPVPKPKTIFVPTTPDPNAQHKQQLVESANDHDLTSKAKTALDPNAIMPQVDGKLRNPNLNDSPNVKTQETPQPSTTPPTPKQAQPQKPTPPQTQPQKGTQTPSPQPAKPTPPTPPQKPQPTVDANGFPVLPPLNAPTMAPPDSASQPLAPAPSQAQQAASVHGALGRSGDNSPAAMATDLGKYKQYVYSVVGSHWYPDVNQHFGIIPVGVVHIQFTIHSDGTITDVTVLEGGNIEILRDISKNALISPAPYKPFTAEMIKQVGDSYTDDFSFSVY